MNNILFKGVVLKYQDSSPARYRDYKLFFPMYSIVLLLRNKRQIKFGEILPLESLSFRSDRNPSDEKSEFIEFWIKYEIVSTLSSDEKEKIIKMDPDYTFVVRFLAEFILDMFAEAELTLDLRKTFLVGILCKATKGKLKVVAIDYAQHYQEDVSKPGRVWGVEKLENIEIQKLAKKLIRETNYAVDYKKALEMVYEWWTIAKDIISQLKKKLPRDVRTKPKQMIDFDEE